MSTEEKVSALQENISRKGNNSYYYAHGAKIDGPAWDGKEEPRLLKSSVISSESTKKMVSAFESFSWLDGSKSVKIFIDFESASSVDDDKITLKSTEKSIEFKAIVGDKEHVFIISQLHKSISGATYKKKSDKFVLILKKVEEEEDWINLKETS
mmetsp:Transcript_16808/g.23121  ORF Transcript_16808/g.23121 Transcript_16808/m.23121 type:complete len:154 (-) Transcript_16808:59-520(-)